jgi:pimeloyl-ACP methyl ester carboxylesterase
VPFLTIQRTRLDYDDIPAKREGAPPLVLLHEGLGSVALWRDFPNLLAAATGCRTITYSRQGYGMSDRLAEPRPVDYMYREAREILPQVIDALSIDDPVLIGHSDGASIAMIYAGDGRWQTRALVLMAPHVFVEDVTIAGIAAAKAAYQSTDLRERLARYHGDVDDAFWGWNNIWLNPEFRQWNIENTLGGIRCPILMIQGSDDEYGTLAQFERIRAGVSTTQITELVLPDCRHSPHRDQPAATLRAITDFVAAV